VGFLVGDVDGKPVGRSVGDDVGAGVGLSVLTRTRMVCDFWISDQSQWTGQPVPYL